MIPIYDTGHGYNTPGKRSVFHTAILKGKNIPLLKENCVNEAVANKLSMLYWLNKKEHHFITNEWWDVPLSERVSRENVIARKIKDQSKKSFFMSIHADAFHKKDAAKGGRFFYYSNKGKEIAYHFTSHLEGNGYGLRLREPMKANFKMLRDTVSPAVLFEMGFMTTETDLTELRKDTFRNQTAKLLYEASIDL